MRSANLALLLSALALAAPASGAELKLVRPLDRTAYQTNEFIDLSVVRSDAQALAAGDLTLTLTGEDGSQMRLAFPLRAVPMVGNDARTTEHVRLNGWLLRPGRYTVEAAAHGATAQTAIELYSHIRKSSFRLVDWASRATGAEQAVLGEEGLGLNTLLASYGGLSPDDAIRAGLDYMWCCTMGGGHQMDLRQECDWSDPYVLAGGTARVVRQAFRDRTKPNCMGVHFYDEPGLTWWQHQDTGENVPYNVPAQDRAFASAFGEEPIPYNQVNPDDPESVQKWLRLGRWKESFLEAAWKLADFGVTYVRPDFLSANQAVYGWYAFSDGYYFNASRSLPLILGHGGYDDWGPAYYHPLFVFEFGRMRDLQKPNWYLPMWFGNIPSDRFRMEQYMCFANNLQGMMKPPDLQIHRPSQVEVAAEGIVESNKLMARLGTIFTTMPVTRPEVAVLYSLSHCLHNQTRDMKDAYLGGGHARYSTFLAFLAGKMIQTPLFPIVEEDILDGTLADHHKAVVIPGVDYLPPNVISALEDFISKGGAVIVSDDSEVQIEGATRLGVPVDISYYETLDRLWTEQKLEERARIYTAAGFLKAAEPIAKALQGHFQRLGMKPIYECDNASIIPARQAFGDIEYLFAVNATYDEGMGGMNALKPAEATIGLPDDGRPVYDAILGGEAPSFAARGGKLTAKLRFGPGQMRAFARTARPIGGIHVGTPTLFADYTVAEAPVRVNIVAALVDTQNRLLVGSAPLRIRVVDPLGLARYDLYRATDKGVLNLTLPLAANDPAGEWRVTVQDLLANTEGRATFSYTPPAQCGALAGAVHRAMFFGRDRESVFRFCRVHNDVTIVRGTSDYNAAAADRLADILKPWNVRCTIVAAAEVNRPRELTEEEARTWVGLDFGRANPARDNPPGKVGFDIRGPVILLGTPEDNPLIAFLQQQGFLPYVPGPDFPGRGRGYLAWQLDGIGVNQESITLIAYDGDGMAEAVGTLYEAAAGLQPLMPLDPPTSASIQVAPASGPRPPQPSVAWQLDLPDRVAAMEPLPNGSAVMLTQDGSVALINAAGKVVWQKIVTGGEAWALDADEDGGVIAVGASQHLICFDAKGKQLCDVPLTPGKTIPAVTFVAVSPDGSRVAAGGRDGQLTLVNPSGERAWTIGGVDANQEGAQADPYLSAAFSADGQTLVAVTAKEAHVISVVDGSIIARLPGFTGKVPPARLGDDLLLTDGAKRLARISAADGKVISETTLPSDGIVAMAPIASGVLVATETDGTVRLLPAIQANAAGQPTWSHTARRPAKPVSRRIVKQIATGGGHIAVAYWGGTLHILDSAGQPLAADAFEHDIAAMAWLGDHLLVALSNARILGLTLRNP